MNARLPACIALIGILFTSCSKPSTGTEVNAPRRDLPDPVRFEVVQSTLAAKWTFRLDRFTGRVSQLVRTRDGNNAWQEMRIVGLPATDASLAQVRFGLFVSTIAAKFTFLTDLVSGESWTLTGSADENNDVTDLYWVPFAK
jgi:hypothetical protein